MITKEEIIHNLDVVIRQFNLSTGERNEPELERAKVEFFDSDTFLQNRALIHIKHLMDYEQWDQIGIAHYHNKERKYCQEKFVDNFNCFEEFDDFLSQFVLDAEEYHNNRDLKINVS